ncbi:hypothetical protein N9Y42_08250 [Mariniblastus sp.]|nr:hypothetical protein [Mariniblastus sp.]
MKTIRSAAICLVAVVVLVGTRGLFADEPAARFLDALRSKGYYDIALEYLEKIKDDPNVPSDFRKRISYEKAITLIDQVGQLTERSQIDAQLDEAQKLLGDYAASNSSLVETVRSLSFRSRLLSMRADVYLGEAEGTQLTEGERQALRIKARGYLEESLGTVGDALASAKRLLDPTPGNSDALKISADDPQSRTLVKEIRNIYRVMTVQRPFNAEQLAYTFPDRAPERKQLLQDAAAQYKRIWEGSYSNTVSGLRACLHAGLCYQQLGNDKEALDFFKQLISRDRTASIDALQKEAFAAAGDSWQRTDPYPARSVISQLEPVVGKLSRSENRDPAWLRVKLELGIAKYEMSKIVKKEDGPNASTKSKKIVREAGRLVRDVTRVKNPYRDRARALLEEWNVPLIEPAELAEETGELNSFSAALEVGNDEISSIELLAGEFLRARNAVKSAPPAEQEELTAEAEQLGKQLEGQADQTISTLNLALALAGPNTTPDEINTCRFYQTYCYFVTNRHLEVSVIGEYLLKRHPDDAGTKPAAGLLLKSRSALYAAAPKDDNQAELQSLKNTALEVAKRWPGTPQAGDAITELIQISLREGDMPQAIELMDRLPDDSAQRPKLSAMMGQRLWNAYQKDSKDPALQANETEMKKKLTAAVRFLEVGESLTDPESMSFSDAVTGLNLIDAMLEADQAGQAAELLESSPLSPLEVIKKQNPAVFGHPRVDLYKSSAYGVIIKTYLAKLGTANDSQVWIDKANGVIELMKQEAEASGSDAAKRQLTAIYYLISVELGEIFENTSEPQQRLQLANAMADFLVGIEQNATDGRVLLNAGSALMSMATGLSEGGMEKEARGFFVKASKALSRAEKLGFAGASNEAALKRELQRQRALAQRGAGKFQEAVDAFSSLLKESKSLAMQLDAAATLQQWGKSQGLSAQLAQAVNGTGRFEDPRTKRQTNAIWGWNKIMRLTQRDKVKYREQYFTASYGIAEAIYEQGKAQKKDASKKALDRIKDERARSPNFLGSTVWKEKFLNLENRIKGGG